MNILISTTTNWNPGDDFIRYGVKNLLNSIISPAPNYIHYDRNPDYFKSDAWEMGSGHKSNIMNDPIDWPIIDAVVLAGSPEFLHGPMKPLYEGLMEHYDIPLLALGVGYSNSVDNLILSHEECGVLMRKNTLIITRQYDLQKKLEEITGNDAHCLPCPALFAAPERRGRQHPKSLYIPQSRSGNQALSEEDYNSMMSCVGKSNDLSFLVHYIDDLEKWPNAYFSTEARDLLDRIIQYKEVVSNRLHGGIVALGAGSSVQIINSSNRVQKALEPYSPYLKDGVYKMTVDEVLEIEKQYRDLIKEYL